jgi:hypothetical protein
MPPNSFTHLSTALSKLSILLTSTAPMPITLAPLRAVAMLFAMLSVFSTFLPIIQALAPRWTRARTCALHIVPPPPVQNTTLLSRYCAVRKRSRAMNCSFLTKNSIFPHIGHIFSFGGCHDIVCLEVMVKNQQDGRVGCNIYTSDKDIRS